MEGGGKVRGMKEILAAIDEGGERGLDLSDAVCTSGLDYLSLWRHVLVRKVVRSLL